MLLFDERRLTTTEERAPQYKCFPSDKYSYILFVDICIIFARHYTSEDNVARGFKLNDEMSAGRQTRSIQYIKLFVSVVASAFRKLDSCLWETYRIHNFHILAPHFFSVWEQKETRQSLTTMCSETFYRFVLFKKRLRIIYIYRQECMSKLSWWAALLL